MNKLEKLGGFLSRVFGEQARPAHAVKTTSTTRATRAPSHTIAEGPPPPGMIGHAVRRQEFQRAMRSARNRQTSQTCTSEPERLYSKFNRLSAKEAARRQGIRDTFNEKSNNHGIGR